MANTDITTTGIKGEGKNHDLNRLMDDLNLPKTNTIIMADDLPEREDDWTIMFRNGTADHIPFFALTEGFELDMNDYHAIATVSGPAVKGGDLLFRLTQNAFESWSRDHAGSHDNEHWGAWDMKVAPLHIDAQGEEWGHRSSMVGDIFVCNRTSQAWVVCGVGFAWIGKVEMDGIELSNDPRHD